MARSLDDAASKGVAGTGYEGANGPWGSCACPRVTTSSTPSAS